MKQKHDDDILTPEEIDDYLARTDSKTAISIAHRELIYFALCAGIAGLAFWYIHPIESPGAGEIVATVKLLLGIGITGGFGGKALAHGYRAIWMYQHAIKKRKAEAEKESRD